MVAPKLEKNDVPVPRSSINLFNEEGIIGYPANFGEDAVWERELAWPGETLCGGRGGGGGEGREGKSVDCDGGVGCTRFGVSVVKVSQSTTSEKKKGKGAPTSYPARSGTDAP